MAGGNTGDKLVHCLDVFTKAGMTTFSPHSNGRRSNLVSGADQNLGVTARCCRHMRPATPRSVHHGMRHALKHGIKHKFAPALTLP